ncbi:hypothetical protein BC937DRAFT_91513 [Endogone sp. FLAS-F59071]|nr:hypothetical protein BC937DRAFT_91513 [Endogone sp. FLAS-F59071]|eukprot:RUS21758.1 hypothetical protein BC937DRAFT_91513 [Endogone sp. FLAS-F59071]
MTKEFIDDYINDIRDQNLDDIFLKENRPQYHPDAPGQTTPNQSSSPSSNSAPSQPRSFDLHRPTIDPYLAPAPPAPQQKQKRNLIYTSSEFLDQKREIHQAALDNCADLHSDLLTCFQTGSWWDKARLCEDQKQKFWNCYNEQKKTLKDLNYKSSINTPQENEEILRRAELVARVSKGQNSDPVAAHTATP